MRKKWKGRCYEAADEAARKHKRNKPVIVHGWIRKDIPVWTLHAWCEVNDAYLYDWTMQYEPFEKVKYYKTHHVSDLIRKYDYFEYIKIGLKHRHYGPFDPIFDIMANPFCEGDPVEKYKMYKSHMNEDGILM